ncbi:hypothetical protein EHQ53_14225 [Leptospira langatensis]|uniref:PD-(D/E)XK endonuclease-like domain-containing protein n=1 Tax=Leptospira langatensis TaxID=2484983 RepID=A0ABY2M9B6_9LEPT|nr:hypothetical protein [Leptospira langatensis]TGL39674.1 hypothetical protein EHQ53_14225 [Leptospira langatensis]
MEYTNKFNIPEPIVKAIMARESKYSKGDAKYSITELQNPPRIIHLKKRHSKEIVRDISEFIKSWKGSLMHADIEKHEAGHVVTGRVFIEIGGVKVSGHPDSYDANEEHLSDYKETSVYSYTSGNKDQDYAFQTNEYAVIYREVLNFGVKKVSITFSFSDWKLSDYLKNPDKYPPPILTLELDLWDHEKAKELLESKVFQAEMYESYSNDELPECSDADKWMSAPFFKVFKEGNKTAVAGGSRFASREEAEQFIADLMQKDAEKTKKGPAPIYRIDEIKSVPKRCLHWCDVRDFCCYAPPKTDLVEVED